jgi:hypothetical protein
VLSAQTEALGPSFYPGVAFGIGGLRELQAINAAHALTERWAGMPPQARAEMIIEVVDEQLRSLLKILPAPLELGLTSSNSRI